MLAEILGQEGQGLFAAPGATKGPGELGHVPDKAVVRGHQGEALQGAFQGDEDVMAVNPQGFIGQVRQPPELGPPGFRFVRGKYPSMENLAGRPVQAIAVAYQGEARLAGIALREEETEVLCRFINTWRDRFAFQDLGEAFAL